MIYKFLKICKNLTFCEGKEKKKSFEVKLDNLKV